MEKEHRPTESPPLSNSSDGGSLPAAPGNADSPSPAKGEGQGEGFTTPVPLSLASLNIPCRHLRSKEMYYQEYGAPDDEFSSGVYWCGKTQENFGPDGEPCGKAECSAERTCYLG